MTEITVVTVCFNVASTIRRTLESVRAQTGIACEHIVIDGGSTDGTMEIVHHFRDDLAQIVSEPDDGLYHAMNKGLALARGTLTGFLNADDVFGSERALLHLAETQRRHNADAAFGDVLQIDHQGRPARLIKGGRFTPAGLRRGLMPPHPAFYARTELLRRLGGFDTSYRLAADFDLIARLYRSPGFRAAYDPRVQTLMRLGGLSTRGLQSTRLATSEIMRSCRANGIDATTMSLLSRYPLKVRELAEGRWLSFRGHTPAF